MNKKKKEKETIDKACPCVTSFSITKMVGTIETHNQR